jgi:hypothetical protein
MSSAEEHNLQLLSFQSKKSDKYDGGIFQIYLKRIKNISFGFGGSNFFASQSGEKAPWYLNPNVTFPTMIAIVISAFIVVFTNGSVKEKGASKMDLEVAKLEQHRIEIDDRFFS